MDLFYFSHCLHIIVHINKERGPAGNSYASVKPKATKASSINTLIKSQIQAKVEQTK